MLDFEEGAEGSLEGHFGCILYGLIGGCMRFEGFEYWGIGYLLFIEVPLNVFGAFGIGTLQVIDMQLAHSKRGNRHSSDSSKL